MRAQWIGLCLAVVLGWATSVTAQIGINARFVRASWDNLETDRERNEASGIETIFFTNRSDEPIVVLTVKLTDCTNLRTTCGVHKVKAKVGPKERKMVLRVFRRDRDEWFTFGYSFTWQPDRDAEQVAQREDIAREAFKDTTAFHPANWENLLLGSHLDEMGDGQVLTLENRSDETVVVTSLTLLDCMNIRTECGPHPMNIVVGSGEKKLLLTVRWSGGGLATSYRTRFEWHRLEERDRR